METAPTDFEANKQEYRLALMSAIMGWLGFQMNQAVQPQLLRLEDAFEEARRASVTIQDEMKIAVLLRCLSGQLRTHVRVTVKA